jgi:hypothetical protein
MDATENKNMTKNEGITLKRIACELVENPVRKWLELDTKEEKWYDLDGNRVETVGRNRKHNDEIKIPEFLKWLITLSFGVFFLYAIIVVIT